MALDDNPGKLFHGRVDSIGWGITKGGEAPTGQLPDVQPAAGWLREPQRFPVRIMLTPSDDVKRPLAFGRSGAQANVIVFTEDDSTQPDRQAVDAHRFSAELSAMIHRPVRSMLHLQVH